MKIGIDARICGDNGYYHQFVCELVEAYMAEERENQIVLYTKKNLPYIPGKLTDDIQVKKIFENEKFHMVLFFDYHIPWGYKGEYIVLIESLKEVFFPKKRWLHRKIYSHKLKRALEKSNIVIALDSGTAMELNENLNIHEDKIRSISGFFPKYMIHDDFPVAIDIKKKYNLSHDYLIYDSGNEVHNNFERILKTIKKLEEKKIFLYVLILCEDTTKDIDIRNKVLEYNISQHTIFLGNIPKHEEIFYYQQSQGVIFSSIYESFPFHFHKALAYNCNIFANNIPANTSVMGDRIHYLDPLSIHNMCDTIMSALKKQVKKNQYTELGLSAQNSALQLKSILQEKN